MGRSNEENGEAEIIAKDGHIEGRIVRLTDRPARVSYYADDAEHLADKVDTKVLAQGIFVGEKAISGLLADEDNVGVLQALPGSKGAAAKDRYSSRGKVVGVSGANQEVETRAIGNGWMLEDGDQEISTPTLAGRRRDQSCCLDARDRANSAK